MPIPLRALGACLLFALGVSSSAAQTGPWRFAVSGDSRNCGDIVMPAIANGVRAENAAFYWHLGDFRAIYRFDQDYWQTHLTPDPRAMLISNYIQNAWQDFIDNQLKAFGNTPVYLAPGNHEVIPPKTHEDYIVQFADWLDMPTIREQRLRDNAQDSTVHPYYHWIKDGIDFVTLDNSSNSFDKPQLKWLKLLINRDTSDAAVRALVVGMHEALPQSISADHSMDQSAEGEDTGLQAYQALLTFKAQSHKPVYVLSSHSHYFMEDIFNTGYWRTHGGILPGWIIGTAGAERYKLPPNWHDAKQAKTYVYGYLLATVTDSRDDPIHFEFRQLSESDVPPDVSARYTPSLVHECWVENPKH